MCKSCDTATKLETKAAAAPRAPNVGVGPYNLVRVRSIHGCWSFMSHDLFATCPEGTFERLENNPDHPTYPAFRVTDGNVRSSEALWSMSAFARADHVSRHGTDVNSAAHYYPMSGYRGSDVVGGLVLPEPTEVTIRQCEAFFEVVTSPLYRLLTHGVNEPLSLKTMLNRLPFLASTPQISQRHPGKVGYFESSAKAMRGIVTWTRPGRYLLKFFTEEQLGGQDAIARIGHLIELATKPVALEVLTDAEAIVHAYQTGPHSCMTFKNKRDGWIDHPVRVYAGPDLALAIIKNDGGDIAGRAVCWPDKKLYGRVYGDERRLTSALDAAGFTSPYGAESLVGARINRIRHSEDDRWMLMPYLDGGLEFSLNGGEDYVTLSHSGSGFGESTDGYVMWSDGRSAEDCDDDENTFTCQHCDERHPDRDFNSTYDGGTCDGCYSEHYTFCELQGDAYPNDDVVEVYGSSRYSSFVTTDYADNYCFYSDHSETYFTNADHTAVDVIVNSRGDTEIWTQTEVENADNVGFCEVTETHAFDDLLVRSVEGNVTALITLVEAQDRGVLNLLGNHEGDYFAEPRCPDTLELPLAEATLLVA